MQISVTNYGGQMKRDKDNVLFLSFYIADVMKHECRETGSLSRCCKCNFSVPVLVNEEGRRQTESWKPLDAEPVLI